MDRTIESFYGLRRAPFFVSGSTGPVLVTEPLRRARRWVLEDLEADRELIFIDGAFGTGKTSLCRALPKVLSGSCRVVSIREPNQKWGEILDQIVLGFELDDGQLSARSLRVARERGRRLVLIVDDCDRLTPRALERIGVIPRLRGLGGEPLVQVILLGDVDRTEGEAELSLRAWIEMGTYHQLDPLPSRDVYRYLDARLKGVGYEGDPLFSESAALSLHRLTGGNPGALSAACAEILATAAVAQVRDIDARYAMKIAAHFTPPEPPEPEPVFDELPKLEVPKSAVADWNERAPLTAASIAGAPSLELEDESATDQDHWWVHPLQTLRAPVRAPAPTAPIRRVEPPSRRRLRLPWFGWVAVAVVAGIYASPVPISEVIQQISAVLPGIELR